MALTPPQYKQMKQFLESDQRNKKFSLLQDDVPGKSGKEISKLVRKAYNIKSLDEIFDSFDLENPLGSASIGQTHLATLKESGETVVVKVMYPDAEDKFYKDMATMRSFATIAQPAYGAKYCNVAGSLALAATITEYCNALFSSKIATAWATVDAFCPIAT